jgi:putative transcriptional regulator
LRAAPLLADTTVPMGTFTPLTNQFLIAMPALADPNFSRTVTLICDHSPEGALGVVINRPMELTLGDLLEQVEVDTALARHTDAAIQFGGPVQNTRGFVLHEPVGHWESTLAVSETLGLTTSQDILHAIAEDRGPDNWLVALGYAGWGAGQLEQELADNAWLNGPADSRILFHVPLEERWRAAAAHLGVDLGSLHGDAGHA